MASQNKFDKVSKRKHWGRGGGFLKNSWKGGIRRVSFYNATDRRELQRELRKELINIV